MSDTRSVGGCFLGENGLYGTVVVVNACWEANNWTTRFITGQRGASVWATTALAMCFPLTTYDQYMAWVTPYQFSKLYKHVPTHTHTHTHTHRVYYHRNIMIESTYTATVMFAIVIAHYNAHFTVTDSYSVRQPLSSITAH